MKDISHINDTWNNRLDFGSDLNYGMPVGTIYTF